MDDFKAYSDREIAKAEARAWEIVGNTIDGVIDRSDARRLHFLILTMPDKEIVSVSLREGIDFLDELEQDFGDFYVLETA